MMASLEMVREADSVVAILPGRMVDNFAHVAVDELRAAFGRGQSVRMLLLSAPSSTAQVLRDAGAEVRVLDELREVAFLATHNACLMFPATQGGDSSMELCAVLLPDVLTAAHLRLAFEESWDRAKAPP